MIKFCCFLFLLFTLKLYAWSDGLFLQYGMGGLTPHFVSRKLNYCNQWNNTGIIFNRSGYVRAGYSGYSLTYIRAEDSICSAVEGLFFHFPLGEGEIYDLSLTLGGYRFNMQKWKEHAKNTPSSIAAPSPVWTKVDPHFVVPVLALEFSLHLIRAGNYSLKLNNLLTAIIFNHSLAFEYRF